MELPRVSPLSLQLLGRPQPLSAGLRPADYLEGTGKARHSSVSPLLCQLLGKHRSFAVVTCRLPRGTIRNPHVSSSSPTRLILNTALPVDGRLQPPPAVAKSSDYLEERLPRGTEKVTAPTFDECKRVARQSFCFNAPAARVMCWLRRKCLRPRPNRM
jgi:hypothetical protein